MARAAMTERRRQRHERWRRLRTEGRWAYTLKWGVLYWGGMLFLVMGLLVPWIDGNEARLSPRGLLISAIAWLIGGLLYGLLTWHFSEKAFLRNEPEHTK